MHAQPSSGVKCLIFGRPLRLLPYFMCANSEGSGETARMPGLTWAFVGHLCDKYHNLMSWLICFLYHDKTFWQWGMIKQMNIRAVAGQGRSPESGFANKIKMFFRAKNKRREITGPWNIGHCDLNLFWGQKSYYTDSFSKSMTFIHQILFKI